MTTPITWIQKKPPTFDGEAANWRPWKLEMEGVLELNEMDDVITDARSKLPDDVDDIKTIINAIYPPQSATKKKGNAKDASDQAKKRRAVGVFIKMGLPLDIKRLIDQEIQQYSPHNGNDGAVIWLCLEHLMERRNTAATGSLLQKLLTAKCRPGEGLAAFGRRVRGINQEIRSASDNLGQDDKMLVQIILLGLPSHMEAWKDAFAGRNEKQKGLERLLADLMEYDMRLNGHTDATILPDKAEPLSAMHKHSAHGSARMPSCTKCGGSHETVKCTWQGTCHKCKRRGHKKAQCRTKNGSTDEMQILQAVKACQFTKAPTATQDLRQQLMAKNSNIWALDSGSEEHTTPYRDLLTNVSTVTNHRGYVMANGAAYTPTLKGTVNLLVTGSNGHESILELQNVFYLPGSPCNLISEGVLRSHDHHYNSKSMQIDFSNGFSAPLLNSGMLPILVSRKQHAILAKPLWHARLNHIGHQHLQKLPDHVEGLTKKDVCNDAPPCDACPAGKSKRPPFPKHATQRVFATNQLLVSDLGGIMPPDVNQKRHSHIFVDVHTREGFLYLMEKKSQVTESLSAYIKDHDVPGTIRTDGAAELTDGNFRRMCTEHFIKQESTCAHTPQQNGIAEKRLAVLEADAKCMCAQANLPFNDFWGYAYKAANHVRNRLLSKVEGMPTITPFERRTGIKPDMTHIRVFGCVAYVHHPSDARKKPDMRATRGIFVGYPEHKKGWIVLDPVTGKEMVSRDVIFHENIAGSTIWPRPGDWHTPPNEANGLEAHEAIEADPITEDSLPHTNQTDNQRNRRNAPPPAKYRDSLWHLPKIMATEVIIPENHTQAMASPYREQWQQAEAMELAGMDSYDVYTVIPKEPNQPTVKSKWVYAIKSDTKGLVTKFKARIVAKGYTQVEGRDYTLTYSPVGNTTSLRSFLAVAAAKRQKPRNVDCTMAFLHAGLDERILLEPPTGVHIPTGHCWLLQKSLYGLKQSSRNFGLMLTEWLQDHQWQGFHGDPCLWCKNGELVYYHVDDLKFLPASEDSFQKWLKQFSRTFRCKDLGAAEKFLGMNIAYQTDGTIILHQQSYINKILTTFRMNECKPISTPAVPLSYGNEEEELPDNVPYRQAIGALHFLSNKTRPDIAYAVSVVASRQIKPMISDWVRIKRIFRYLKGTPSLGIKFKGGGELNITAYCDADFGGDLADRKSRSGFVVCAGEAPIEWMSKKQSIVALSTAEAEYIAMAKVSQAVSYAKFLLEFTLNEKIDGPIEIRGDNKAAISIIDKPTTVHDRSRHIQVKYHHVRERVANREIYFRWIASGENIADIFTKALSGVTFAKFARMLMKGGASAQSAV